MDAPARIVVAHASVGSGHRVAAEAVARELSELGGERVSVEVLDMLEYGSYRADGDALTTTFTGPTARLYDAMWRSAGLGRLSRALAGPFLSWNYRRFRAALESTQPAAVVCTHAGPAVVAARALRRGSLRTKLVSVTTDFGVHGFWPRRDAALFCVADEPSRTEVVARGTEPETVVVTGVPVRPQFTLEYDRAAARRHFELPEDKRVVLALAGSTMPGPYARFKESLAVSLPALASLPDTSVVVVCGRDDEFATAMRSRAAGFGTTNVQVLGFVENMAPLMACADLVLAKPGGLVCAECVDVGVPLVLIGPAVGQEKANASALTAAGAALYSEDPRLLAEWARKAISKPKRLAAMRAAAESLARPWAARDVAERTLALTGIPAPETPEQ